jgi:peptidoglycan/LPS O-acetylase OafA/YrhL
VNRPRNNLDALRLFAAMLVLVGHSYIFMGVTDPIFLAAVPLGPLGVSIFFVISGYLVSESWDRDPDAVRFLARRALRIVPGLAVCIFLTAFLLGPALTTLPLSAYFKHPTVWDYLYNIGLYISYSLPGVFEKNRIAHSVNGSLWSLPVEFLLYLVVALVGLLRGNRWVYLSLGIASAIATVVWAWTTEVVVFYRSDVRQVVIYGTYFLAGAVIYKFNLRRYFSLTNVVLAFVALILMQRTGLPMAIALWTMLPLIVMAFGLASGPMLTRLTSKGDYSYGIYIYAFPIQQTVAALKPGIHLVPYIILCTLLTLAYAVASWHLVEHQALRFKPRQPVA